MKFVINSLESAMSRLIFTRLWMSSTLSMRLDQDSLLIRRRLEGEQWKNLYVHYFRMCWWRIRKEI